MASSTSGNTTAIKAAIELHRQAQTRQEKAQLEERLWRLCDPQVRHATTRRNWLVKTLGREQTGSLYALAARRALLDAPDFLWERVNNGLNYEHALKLYRAARRANHGAKLDALDAGGEQQLRELLVQYDNRPDPRAVIGAYDKSKSRKRPAGETSKAHWRTLRTVFGQIVDAKFAKRKYRPTDAERAQVLEFLESEVRSVIRGINARVQQITGQLNGEGVTRRQVLTACHVLSVVAPKPGCVVDLREARRRKRQLAAQYHPDKVGAAMRDQYEEVIAAFATLEVYNSQVAQNGDDK